MRFAELLTLDSSAHHKTLSPRQREQPIIIIAAMTPDRVIGAGDGMPWDLPKEYQQFLDKVRGQTVLMGRKSYEIFHEDLPSQHNIVVSRSGESFPGATTVDSMEAALDAAKATRCRVYICGGAQIYKQALEFEQVVQMDLSIIGENPPGDAYFPEFDKEKWELTAREQRDGYEFVRYARVKAAEPAS